MKIPTSLKHKPVIISENYENVDGRHAYRYENLYNKEDIKLFTQVLSDDGELIGERLSSLSRL